MVTDDKRIRIIIGHYGSGKTEFACNYAIELANSCGSDIMLVDLDIVNPYFRSRERASYLENRGVEVLSSLLGNDVNTDLPALSGGIYAPLSNPDMELILDVGGDQVGARVLRQYRDYLDKGDVDVFAVINANRPETAEPEGVIKHLEGIEFEGGLKITGLINNTHMIWDTTIDDIIRGHKLLLEVSDRLKVPIVYTSVVRRLVEEVEEKIKTDIIPIDMIMRDVWM